jgi:serine/threonine-protein kinase HipA
VNRCPITYLPVEEGRYSREGLDLLSPQLANLNDFPYGEQRQLELMLDYSDKLSFSGVQPKLSAKLNIQSQLFEVVRTAGTFLLKLPRARFSELPQNEDLTMKLAALAGIVVPEHGMVYAVDHSLLYFIKRFDRISRKKVHAEDLGQLSGLSREKKCDSSMEKIGQLIDQYCTFPMIEKKKLFRLILFNFLVGNEDMHVKNFSLLTKDKLIELSPAYDLVNSTIVLNSKEEIALPLRGKKSNLRRSDWIDYFGKERLALSVNIIDEILQQLLTSLPNWQELIKISFLSAPKKECYLDLLEKRSQRLFGSH